MAGISGRLPGEFSAGRPDALQTTLVLWASPVNKTLPAGHHWQTQKQPLNPIFRLVRLRQERHPQEVKLNALLWERSNIEKFISRPESTAQVITGKVG